MRLRESKRRDSPSFDFAQDGELVEPRGCPHKSEDRDTSPAKGGLSAGKPCPYAMYHSFPRQA